MRTLKALALAAMATTALAGAAHAQTAPSSFAVGAHVGTTGIGAEAFWQLSPNVTLRGGGDYGRLDRDLESNDISYDGKAEWKTANIGVDFHPMANPLFLSAGLYAGDRSVDVDAVSARNVVTGGVTFTAAQIGAINGKASLSDTAPFIGLGWDNTFYTSGQVGVRVLAGVAFSDDPDVKLTATGPFANQALVQAYLREEERQIQDDADAFKTYPVLSVGVNYRF